jgi:ATP-binding cassette subfamily A (ABC1) protein 3
MFVEPPSPGYYYEGFLAIQRAVDLSIMDELSGGNLTTSGINSNINLRLKSFPYPPYVDDTFIFILTTQFPFIIMLSYIVIAPVICKDVVLEKEKKLKVCDRKSNSPVGKN